MAATDATRWGWSWRGPSPGAWRTPRARRTRVTDSAQASHRGYRVAIAALMLALSGGPGCHAARVLAPAPALQAASAAMYAIDLQFAEPLERASAQDISHYVLYPAAKPGSPAAVSTATLVDTLYGRVVQLLIPAWFGDSTVDATMMTVEARGVLDVSGRSTGDRTTTFRTGPSYAQP